MNDHYKLTSRHENIINRECDYEIKVMTLKIDNAKWKLHLKIRGAFDDNYMKLSRFRRMLQERFHSARFANR